MNIYQARFENAKRIARKMNELLARGYIILDPNGGRIDNPFEITDTAVYEVHRKDESGTSRSVHFEMEKNYDHGMYTPIQEYNKFYDNWVAIHPRHFKSVMKTPIRGRKLVKEI